MKTKVNGKKKMNSKKSFLIKVTALALVLLLMPFCPVYKTVADVSKYGRSADGLWTYKLLDKNAKTVALRPNKLGQLPTNVSIPSYITIQGEKYTVTRVGKDAFSQCLCNDCLKKNKKSLEVAWEDANGNYTGEDLEVKVSSITVPASVNYIEKCAFEYVEAGQIKFASPTQIKIFDEGAFSGFITSEFEVPSTVTTIGEDCFEFCEIGNISFEKGSVIKSFGVDAFKGAEINKITLPSSLTSINEGCFGESSLTSIDIPASVSEIKEGAFAKCLDLKKVNIPSSSNLSKIGEGAFAVTKISELELPSGIKTIEDYAFTNCDKLKSVTFNSTKAPSSVSKLAFVKVPAFDEDSEEIDALPDHKSKTNDSVEKVYVDNYDVYKWVCGRNLFDDGATVYSDKTRVFVGSKSDDRGNVGGTATISFDNYFKNKKGYHYENNAYEYGNKININKTTKNNVSGNSFATSHYPYVVLTSNLKANTYQIHFDGNAKNVEDVSSSNLHCTYDEAVHIPKAEPKRKGHTFRGWSKYKNGKGTFYKPGQKVKENFTSVDKDVVTLYGAWEVIKMKIKADLNGGESNQKEVTANYGAKLSDVLYAPTRDGYDFLGWSLSEKGKVVDKDYTIDKETDFTVYAQWKKNTKKVTVTFSQPKNTDRDSFYEITVTRDGQMIQSHNVMASDMGIEKVVLTGAKVGEKYVITCTNYVKEKGRKKYFTPVTKEVVIEK